MSKVILLKTGFGGGGVFCPGGFILVWGLFEQEMGRGGCLFFPFGSPCSLHQLPHLGWVEGGVAARKGSLELRKRELQSAFGVLVQ